MKPEIWSSDLQQIADNKDLMCHCGIKLKCMPRFLYTTMYVGNEASRNDGYMKKIVDEATTALKAQARAVRDELNGLDLE